jgi:hypothetical protein
MPLNTGPRYTYDDAKYQAAAPQRAAADEAQRRLNEANRAKMIADGEGRPSMMNPFGSSDRGAGRAQHQAQLTYDEARGRADAGGAAYDEAKGNDQSIRDATLGQGDAIMGDAKLGAAQDYLQGLLGKGGKDFQNAMYSQMSDQNAAAAGTQADQLRSSAAASGMNASDPAFQAMQRSTETGRMQANQGALATSVVQGAQMQQQAAGQLASQRLAQYGNAQGAYSQGANLLANKVDKSFFVPSAVAPQNKVWGTPANQPWQPSWTPPTAAKPVAGPVAQAAPKPGLSVAQRNAAQATWDANVGYQAAYGTPKRPSANG